MTHILERFHWRAFFVLLAGCLAALIAFQYGPVGAQEEDIEDDELELVYFATPRVLQKGEQALLEWEAQGADYCVASDSWNADKLPPVGNRYMKPKKLKKYTYTLECYTNDGAQTGEISRIVEVVKKKSQKAPLPSVNFRVNRATISQGGTVTLSWKAKNAVGCRATGPDGWDGLKMASGKEIISPDNSSTYGLRCWNANLKYSDDHNVSISVTEAPQDNKSGYLYSPPSPQPWGGPSFGNGMQQGQFMQGPPPPPSYPPGYFQPPVTIIYPPAPPQPVRITFKPSTFKFYNPGEPIVLSWNARYATACIASGGWSGDRPIEGSEHVRPDDTTTYKLTCYNSDTSQDSVSSVEVRKLVKKMTGSVGLTFSPARSIIYSGKEVTLTWNATNAKSCQASGSWSGEKSLAGSLTVNSTNPETYYLDCKNDTHSKRKSAVIDIFKEQENKSGYIQPPQQIQPTPTPQPEQKPEYKPAPTPTKQSVLRVALNAAVPRSTFKPGAVDVILGSMVVTNGSNQGVYFGDLSVSDKDGTDGLGKSFTNIKLITTAGVQMGGTLADIGKNPGSVITFSGHGVLVPAFGTVTLTLRGDVLSTASLQDDLKSDALEVVSAIEDDQNGGKVFVAQLPVTLQRFALDVAVPEVAVSLDFASPQSTSVETGSLQVELGNFKIATTEAVNIRSLSVEMSPLASGLLKNITVYQGGSIMGTMPDVTTAQTVLPLRLTLDKGNMTVIAIKADIAATVTAATKFKIGVAGLQFEPDSVSAAASNAKVTTTLPVFGAEFTVTPKATTTTQSTSTQSTSTQSQS